MKDFRIGIVAIAVLAGLGFLFGFTAGIWVVEPPQEAYERGYEDGEHKILMAWNESSIELLDIFRAKGYLDSSGWVPSGIYDSIECWLQPWDESPQEAYERGCRDRDSLWITTMQEVTDKLAGRADPTEIHPDAQRGKVADSIFNLYLSEPEAFVPTDDPTDTMPAVEPDGFMAGRVSVEVFKELYRDRVIPIPGPVLTDLNCICLIERVSMETCSDRNVRDFKNCITPWFIDGNCYWLGEKNGELSFCSSILTVGCYKGTITRLDPTSAVEDTIYVDTFYKRDGMWRIDSVDTTKRGQGCAR